MPVGDARHRTGARRSRGLFVRGGLAHPERARVAASARQPRGADGDHQPCIVVCRHVRRARRGWRRCSASTRPRCSPMRGSCTGTCRSPAASTRSSGRPILAARHFSVRTTGAVPLHSRAFTTFSSPAAPGYIGSHLVDALVARELPRHRARQPRAAGAPLRHLASLRQPEGAATSSGDVRDRVGVRAARARRRRRSSTSARR